MRRRRALLFMPSDDRHKIDKGAALDVDTVIMDLEDGVALSRKDAARATIAGALREADFGATERLVRINPVSTTFWSDDLDATVAGQPDGYVIPKVETAGHVAAVADVLTAAEQTNGWPPDSIRLLALVETALGIVNLREIAASSSRLDALIFGAEDLAGDIGARRTVGGMEVLYARSAVVLHAKAFGLDAIDTVYVDLHNLDGLTADTAFARDLGCTGKLAIHPRQVEPIQNTLTPTTEEIAAARRLLDAYHAQQAAGVGAFDLDGKMVDMPIVRAAQAVLSRAGLEA